MNVTHLVWDWNGTIFDDSHAAVAAVNHVCAAYGRVEVDLAYWRSIYRRPVLDAYQELLGRELSMRDWNRIDALYHDAYRGLLPTCRLAAGVPEELKRWRAAGRSQSLLSMFSHNELVPLVTDYDLLELFTRVDGLRAEVGGGTKAEHLADHLTAQHLAPENVLVIGDVADDAAAAAQVGARCVLVTTGVMDRRGLVDSGVPVVDSVIDALRLLG